MKIYTKTGDEGKTSLLGGKRVSKAELRIESYGTIDELNSFTGLVRDQEVNYHRKSILIAIQNKLFTIGSILAAEPGYDSSKIPPLMESDVQALEMAIDDMEKDLPPMRFFVLPGGHPSVSHCHIARTVCRRAERLVISLNEVSEIEPIVIKYLNRLSDYLFVLSRKMSLELGAEEIPWKSGN